MANTIAHVVASPTSQPWRGRFFLLAGVVLLGLSLRHAVTVVSPLLATVQRDIGLTQVGATILGMLPTIAFGIAGFITPTVIRAIGLPQAAVLAMGLGTLGTVVRVTSQGPTLFLVCAAIALFGMGMGNVVGPPLVKRYFPDREGTTMTLLVLTMQGGATVPAMLAVPVAAMAGWRVSVGWWAVLMIVAAVPWITAIATRREAPNQQSADAAPARTQYGPRILFRNPISLGAALFYGMAALNTYAMLAWLPTIFASLGQNQSQAANMYAIYTFVTLPMALVSPIVATKLANPLPFGLLLSGVGAVGYLGILFAPLSTAAVWTFIAGLGGGAFPFAMTMFNLRTRSTAGSAAVTGFAMGCGYALGTIGPLLGGVLSNMTGGWKLSLIVFAATAIPMAVGAVMLTRNAKFEDFAGRASSPA